jgi:hypothetical protein
MSTTQTVAPPPVQALVEWAISCRTEADHEADPEAKAAFEQLGTEFQALADEAEGVLSTFEALKHRGIAASPALPSSSVS